MGSVTAREHQPALSEPLIPWRFSRAAQPRGARRAVNAECLYRARKFRLRSLLKKQRKSSQEPFPSGRRVFTSHFSGMQRWPMAEPGTWQETETRPSTSACQEGGGQARGAGYSRVCRQARFFEALLQIFSFNILY